eukprot:TRINITY_DN11348_c0_g1_i1.p1 TRINITY_DN11348_c0_g1~~TRINITY_DN11348_c0_g1_i1.p1  ORF type:complete len:55 (+),score=2.77 TRINITY_DN11348_c0_g1_i1:262-426(+)
MFALINLDFVQTNKNGETLYVTNYCVSILYFCKMGYDWIFQCILSSQIIKKLNG